MNSYSYSLDCLFIHLINTAVILDFHEIWILLWHFTWITSTVHPLEPFSIPDHVQWSFSDLGGVNTRMFGLLATSSRIKSFTPSFMDILIIPHYSSRTGNQDSMPSEYWQCIPQKWSYMRLMSLEYFNVFLSGQG